MELLSMIGPAMSAGGGLAQMFGGGGSRQPSNFQMPGMYEASNNALGGINSMMQNSMPIGQQATQNVGGAGDYLSQIGRSIQPFASSVMNAGFDPQSDLYNRTAHQIQEQQRAGQSARGIAMSPYGAGLENDAMRNFNIDWQNQQLQRMIQGGQAGANMMGTGGNLVGQGAGLWGQTPGLSMQVPQQGISDYLGFLGAGNQANQVQNQGSNLSFNQGQTIGNNIGQGFAGLGRGMQQPGMQNMFGWGQQSGGNLQPIGGMQQYGPPAQGFGWGG